MKSLLFWVQWCLVLKCMAHLHPFRHCSLHAWRSWTVGWHLSYGVNADQKTKKESVTSLVTGDKDLHINPLSVIIAWIQAVRVQGLEKNSPVKPYYISSQLRCYWWSHSIISALVQNVTFLEVRKKTNQKKTQQNNVSNSLLCVFVPKDQSIGASKPQHQWLCDLQTLRPHQRDKLFEKPGDWRSTNHLRDISKRTNMGQKNHWKMRVTTCHHN